ncbi:aldo/keto reductase [Altericroceibacterium endophyticum]|uniref:Aldo/keto reductase n=1 Tax=Altericroceibacterium endophyticum TaxID=1808508 RepID=A0A6I4T3B8_9SPHN|nr:aldo/keto reductase [Altericroceibacterium endophyticum]MXO64593.1 aldo/keto reductase [Altericroceibacterium endophyticum]
MTHASLSGIPIVLGGNVFGWTADEDTSFAVLDKFYEHGGRMIDTAQGYSSWVDGHSGGESETVLGKWLAARGDAVRGDMRIGTKVNMSGEDGGLAPDAIAGALEQSLNRLQTDYVDLYYAHRDDLATPQKEMAQGFDALMQAGKVREIGASNFDAPRLASAIQAAREADCTPFSVLQNEYNLVKRGQFGADLQNLCLDQDILVFTYFSLASGFLTGKYREKSDLEGQDRAMMVENYLDQGQRVLAKLDKISEETNASLAAISLAWLIAQPAVTAPIASARKPEQLDALLEAARLELSPEQIESLNLAI